MTTHSTIFLPSEAVKAILSFMSRQELIALSGVNRQFLHIVSSPPFESRPLLQLRWIGIFIRGEGSVRVRTVGYGVPQKHSVECVDEQVGLAQLEHILQQTWLRFESEFGFKQYSSVCNHPTRCLPRSDLLFKCDNKNEHAWLKLLNDYSHCLQTADFMILGLHDTLPSEVAELIDGFKTLVGHVEIIMLPD
jgi:hypothetical protein